MAESSAAPRDGHQHRHAESDAPALDVMSAPGNNASLSARLNHIASRHLQVPIPRPELLARGEPAALVQPAMSELRRFMDLELGLSRDSSVLRGALQSDSDSFDAESQEVRCARGDVYSKVRCVMWSKMWIWM